MLISDKHHTRHISKDRISQYIEFALSNKYSTDSREIDPMHVLEWVAEVVKNEDSSLYESCHFKATYYFLIKESKYPMALFLKLLHIRILLDRCKVVDTKVFSYLFEIFLKASKQYATDPKSREILNELPDEIPEDRDKFKGWFLTITNRSFRISSIIDLYIWIVEQGLTINFNNQKNLVDVLNDYLKFLKANYTHSKYKKMRIYIVYLVTFLQGVKEKVELLNNDTQVIITKFANYKTAGIPIFFESQKISDSKWKPTNSIHGQKILKTFITKVIKSRGCTEIGISEFSVFSLTLTDYLGVKVSRNESHTLRQFIPWLLENHTIEECDRAQLMHLYKRMPKAATSTFIAGDGNFISRRDFIVIITTAFRTCQKKTKLKFVIYLCLVGFLALRLSEAVQIQIGDFELDERGLLRDVGNGFGTLVLPAFKSKGGYSPSFKPYNIAVVPKLRDIINMYLETDFMKFHTPETYLLRPNAVREYDPLFDKVPNHIKNALEYALWLDKARDCGEAIALDMFRRTKNQMETKIIGNLSSHDLRRSINDWIKKTPINLPADIVNRIAEIHLRHKSRGSVNQIHYTSKPTLIQYIECINNALNFPWDLNSLQIWEAKRMITEPISPYESENLYPSIPLETEETIFESIPEFIPQTIISPREKRSRDLEIGIEEIERLLKRDSTKNKIMLQSKLREMTKELINIRRV
ncbi:hypothetical protein Desaci_3966 [Desulfosporosinus acidiphilus SJ4]|uniref:Phage integrase family protein n=1 Tax=Desulfosporosinus acidiphilus (strain DSM 22704 / JCM 16185 / SJ4) TaxID=646529 RepID=I4DAL0_DESAJ|nr:hypothetical protein [Desulfosporosinus acidiphilus]AFM42834.1 hypothetical protein Desaci_3966 [Desulfosporosinus acidiphilus SJ4]